MGHAFRTRVLAQLAAGGSLAVLGMPVVAAAQDRSSADPEIVVYGQREGPLSSVPIVDTLGEADIAAYGLDTVGDVIDELSAQATGSREGPVILINGQQTASINDVRDLPAEAVSRVELLGRAAASQLGQGAGRRVINVVIKPDLTQWTGTATGQLATAGGSASGELAQSFVHHRDGNRETVGMKFGTASALDESERDLLARQTGSGPARWRTLIPARENYQLNGTLARRFSATARASLTARYEASNETGLSGGAPVFLRVPNPSDPSGPTTSLRRVFGPLSDRVGSDALTLSLTANAAAGAWQFSLLGNGEFRRSNRHSDYGFDVEAFQALVLAGANPRSQPAPGVLRPLTTQSRARSDTMTVQAVATGPVLDLPAGPAMLTLDADFKRQRFATRTSSPAFASETAFGRDEGGLGANLAVPLLASAGFPGALDLEAGLGWRSTDDAGDFLEWSAGLSWAPLPRWQVDARLWDERRAPSPALYADTRTVLPNVLVYDFVTGTSVEVDYVLGGNPDLAVADERRWELALRFDPRPGLALTAQWEGSRVRGAVGSLPPASAEVQAAFPDRFVRNVAGRLVLVDARPVNFARESEEAFVWGFEWRHAYGKDGSETAGDAFAEDGENPRSLLAGAQATRVLLRANHRWTLSSERQARPGLPVVDLLDGGAAGYGAGLSRHAVDVTAGVAARGMGLQVTGSWRGPSAIRASAMPSPTDLAFAAHGEVSLRAFANLGAIWPSAGWSRGARLTLRVFNLFDTKQRVRDGTGAVPLSYQPALLDPLGRTVSLSLRKIF